MHSPNITPALYLIRDEVNRRFRKGNDPNEARRQHVFWQFRGSLPGWQSNRVGPIPRQRGRVYLRSLGCTLRCWQPCHVIAAASEEHAAWKKLE